MSQHAAQNGQPRLGLSQPGLSFFSPTTQPPSRAFRNSAKGPISRILSCAVIPLGAALPRTLISDLPGGFGKGSNRLNASGRCVAPPGSWRKLPSLFGLAPCGVYPAPASQPERCALTAPFHPYPALRQQAASGLPSAASEEAERGSRGGIFSVALAVHGP